MSEPASISSGIAERYATAIFEIAQESKRLPKLESSVDALAEALNVSSDLRSVISSPVLSRDEQGKAITAIAEHLKLTPSLSRGISLMAKKRRLFALPQLIAQLRAMIGEEKGEVQAEVTSAKALTKAQADQLTKTLTDNIGKDVKINATVDESLVGGLIVKVGSKMIDTSIRSKLASLQSSMKEVG
ncbi:F0F1 ATP synthase subunit delta [Roseovarius dicentrarchi]|uniref:F0F1 ATP synthase subunit delta n=1 Tax=Roseovarius dicentrarchi TaxID=2250573 RepID=UPI000DE80B15|nr:F0F1 ATP synthase subunit delta [Roseovarius dicentrarchi]